MYVCPYVHHGMMHGGWTFGFPHQSRRSGLILSAEVTGDESGTPCHSLHLHTIARLPSRSPYARLVHSFSCTIAFVIGSTDLMEKPSMDFYRRVQHTRKNANLANYSMLFYVYIFSFFYVLCFLDFYFFYFSFLIHISLTYLCNFHLV